MQTAKRNGLFITFEGIDGCGKTTQALLICQHLMTLGYQVTLLREPGSTATAERIRDILLDSRLSISPLTEMLLYEAARAEITAHEIKPVLDKGNVVLCDRFVDSTTAYQGYGRKLDIRMVRSVNRISAGDIVPDLTLLLDIDLDTARSRRTGEADRLESQSHAFFTRVRRGFLEIARKERRRVKVVDGSATSDIVFADICKLLNRKLAAFPPHHRG